MRWRDESSKGSRHEKRWRNPSPSFSLKPSSPFFISLRSKRAAAQADDLAVPAGRIFQRPLLRGEVDVDQAEAVVVGALPLHVVEKAPVEVAGEFHAVGRGAAELQEIAARVVDALGVVYAAVHRYPVGVREAVLGDG